jgi:hypothetical protein
LLGREHLKLVGDHLDGASLAAISGFPSPALEPTLDVGEASLGYVSPVEFELSMKEQQTA